MSTATPTADKKGWFENDPAVAPLTTPGITYLDAINAALDDLLAEDERVILLGEDIGKMGGAFRVTKGLWEKYGDRRVIDTPMAEATIVGAAIGLAVSGRRPIVEMQFADFISCAYDQLVTEAAKLYYRFGISVPLVVRAPSGGGVGAGPFHSANPEGIFAHVPGLKIACPGTTQDAYSLLRVALEDPDPVLYFEHKALYRSLRGAIDRRPGAVQAYGPMVRRFGSHVTLLTYGGSLSKSMAAADELAKEGIDVEIIDLRWLSPLVLEPIAESVRKTGRVVIVHEDTLSFGPGAEVAARLASDAFYDLDAPIVRVAAPDTPVPLSPPLESAFVPGTEQIAEACRRCRET